MAYESDTIWNTGNTVNIRRITPMSDRERGIYPAGPRGNPSTYGKPQRRFAHERCCGLKSNAFR